MPDSPVTHLAAIIDRDRESILADWMREQAKVISRAGAISERDLRSQCEAFLDTFRRALGQGWQGVEGSNMSGVRDLLAEVSRSRALAGYTPSETATFVFSFKRPLFERLRKEFANDAGGLAEATWVATDILDTLGLHTTEVFQKGRDEVIRRQQQDMLELSTPVVNLWDGVLALPLIGTLDSSRTQVVMEALLQRIVDTGADIAILDITGVPTVDTLTAQHLIKTVTAARLMGAECVISGIRPQIAQTIVHLGVDLAGVTTKATLADAFRWALQRSGRSVTRVAAPPRSA